MNFLRRAMETKRANPDIVTRESLTPEFSTPGVVYCSKLAPVEFWVERPGGGKVETYCCLEFGHRGEHRYSVKFRGQEPKGEAKKEGE
jgi:hypothetical protein